MRTAITEPLVSRVMHCLHVPSCGDCTETVYAAVLAGSGLELGWWQSLRVFTLKPAQNWFSLNWLSEFPSDCIYTVYVPPNLVQANAQQCRMEPFLIECVVVWTTIVFHCAKICSERRR